VREFDASSVQALIDKYLRQYVGGTGPVGRFRELREFGRTPSGRVAAVVVQTDQEAFTLRGNEIRNVLRAPNGDILASTNFTIESTGADHITLRGTGYGHGVGMCQWGAIGRARAGQDYRTILATYYPGTTLTRIF
jgi:stage II sporulation protein D